MKMTVKLGGKYWTLRRSRGMKNDGFFSYHSSDRDKRWIAVAAELRGRLELESCIHECGHACSPEVLAEGLIEKAALDSSKLLWMLGWRKMHGETPTHKGQSELKQVLRIVFTAYTFGMAYESWVESLAVDISRVLLQLGYRKKT